MPNVISDKALESHFRLSRISGKKVIADNGEVIGNVKDLAVAKDKVVGIYCSSSAGEVFIARSFVRAFDSDSIILKISPATSLVGKIVFDRDGKRIGKVFCVARVGTSNQIKQILVRKSPIAKPVSVPKKDIDVMDKNIILKKVL